MDEYVKNCDCRKKKKKIDVEDIISLIGTLEDESKLQQNPTYMAFKKSNCGNKNDIVKLLIILEIFKCYNEAIYWCCEHNESRVCNIKEKYIILNVLRESYYLTCCYK